MYGKLHNKAYSLKCSKLKEQTEERKTKYLYKKKKKKKYQNN